MLHLTLVCNLMSAIGAGPTFARPNFPQRSDYFPPSVQLDLLPFGEAALTHFLYLERPEGMARTDAVGFVPSAPPHLPVEPDEVMPRVQDFLTVGHLYRGIAEGMTFLACQIGERALFVGPPGAQATPEMFRWPAWAVLAERVAARASRSGRLGQPDRGLVLPASASAALAAAAGRAADIAASLSAHVPAALQPAR
jgi:hypothetical protein